MSPIYTPEQAARNHRRRRAARVVAVLCVIVAIGGLEGVLWIALGWRFAFLVAAVIVWAAAALWSERNWNWPS